MRLVLATVRAGAYLSLCLRFAAGLYHLDRCLLRGCTDSKWRRRVTHAAGSEEHMHGRLPERWRSACGETDGGNPFDEDIRLISPFPRILT